MVTYFFFILQLEYMDLDEFLNENGIPVEENAKANAANRSAGSSGSADHNSSTSSSSNSNNTSLSPEAPSSPDTPLVGSGVGVVPQAPTGITAAPAAPMTVQPPALSPQDYVGDDYCSSPESSDPNSPSLQVHEPGKNGFRARLLSYFSFFYFLYSMLYPLFSFT